MAITQDWIISLLPLLLVLIIGIVVGGLIGGVIASSQRSSSGGPTPANRSHLRPLVHLWRDKRNAKLVVETEGKILTAEKLTVQQKTALLQIADDFQFWLGSGVAVNRLEALPVSNSPVSPPAHEPSLTPPIAYKTDQLLEVQSAESIRPPSMDVSEIVSRIFTPEPKTKEKIGSKSIAAQVDEILQGRIAGSPFSQHHIRLSEAPDHGIIVVVDSNTYEGVGEIPDPEIKKFIQDCVAEWEKTQ